MSAEIKKPITVEEYFRICEESEEKFQFFNGEIFAMSGGSMNHSLISANCIKAFGNSLSKKPCRVFDSNLRIAIAENDSYTYPDTSVICGEIEFLEDKKDTVANPVVIVEVLSDSTEAFDRGKKFSFYRSIETLKHYILIDQKEVKVEHFFKNEKSQWVLEEFSKLEEYLNLNSIKSKIQIKEIYEKVEF